MGCRNTVFNARSQSGGAALLTHLWQADRTAPACSAVLQRRHARTQARAGPSALMLA
jgi:hypothetical protein